MIKNLIDTELTKENEDQTIRRINEVEILLPFLVGLSTTERRSIPKMGKGSLDFVERALYYAQEHTLIRPPFYDVAGHSRDVVLLRQMKRVLTVLEPLCEKVRDTYMVLGAEAYQASRTFYYAAKGAAKAGVKGCDFIAEDLAERYKKTSTKPTVSPTNPTPTATAEIKP